MDGLSLATDMMRATVQDGIATMTYNNPARHNAVNHEMRLAIIDILAAFAADPGVRVVVITGAGGNFCSGGDVHDIIAPLIEMDMSGLLRFTEMTGDVVKAMRACPQPIVAAVEGIAAGAGAILAMASDIRYGTADAKVAFLFNRVGLAGCDMGACAILPRIIGQGRASELLYTGRSMGGEEALAWGFFNRLCEPGSTLGEATTLAKAIADGPTFGNAITKRQLHQEWAMGVDEAITAEAEAQAICMQTKDFARAYHAFANKERPVFEGDGCPTPAISIGRFSTPRTATSPVASPNGPRPKSRPRRAKNRWTTRRSMPHAGRWCESSRRTAGSATACRRPMAGTSNGSTSDASV